MLKFLESKEKEDEWCKNNMLQVKDLVKYLQSLNQEANILYFEVNSNAWCHTFKELPSINVRTIAEEKKNERQYLETYFKDIKDEEEKEKKIKEQMETVFRYSLNDDDVVMSF